MEFTHFPKDFGVELGGCCNVNSNLMDVRYEIEYLPKRINL